MCYCTVGMSVLILQSSKRHRLSFCRDAEAAVESLARAALTDRATWVHAVRQPLQVCKAASVQKASICNVQG
eukprot:1152030-Pelagomonas_calceolata.AAC.10